MYGRDALDFPDAIDDGGVPALCDDPNDEDEFNSRALRDAYMLRIRDGLRLWCVRLTDRG
jgi:hypothetical protein